MARTVIVKPHKALHPTTALFFHGRNALYDENWEQAVKIFESLMTMLKAEPKKYARYIEICEDLLGKAKEGENNGIHKANDA